MIRFSLRRVRALAVAIGVIAILVTLLGSRSSVSAHQFVVDQGVEPLIDSTWSIRILAPIVQEFIPVSASLDVVELWIGNADSVVPFPALFVNIRRGSIDDPIIGTSATVIVPFYSPGGPVHFDFLSPVPLVPGQVHVIEVVLQSGAGNPGIAGGSQPTYLGGRAVIAGQPTNSDLWFREGPAGTAPSVIIATPVGQTYLHTDVLTLSWTASDASGIASIEGDLEGNPVESDQQLDLLTLTLGEHVLSVSATNGVGNSVTEEVTFTVIATLDSVCHAVERLRQYFTKNTFYNGLLSKCREAQAAQARGQTNVVRSKLEDMSKQLEAQSGKGITTAAADLLMADIQFVLDSL